MIKSIKNRKFLARKLNQTHEIDLKKQGEKQTKKTAEILATDRAK